MKCLMPARRLIAAGLLLVGWAAGATAQDATNTFTSLEDVETGQSLFRAHCGRCHGRDATGELGPDLTSGFLDARSDAGLFELISEGIADTEMPPMFRTRADRSVWQLVSYLRSLNRRPENVFLPGDPTVGERLFRGKGGCDVCHMVGGAGGRLGPDLSAVGDRRWPAELEVDLLEPDEAVDPRWWSIRATRVDGTTVEGIRMNEDTYSIRLLDADENLWSVSKRDLRETERIETSTMPSYEGKLTAEELENVVAYLFSLRREAR